MAVGKVPMRIARELAGLSQRSMAEALGVNVSTVVSWEKGRTEPTVNQAKRISALTGVDLDDIIFLTADTVKP